MKNQFVFSFLFAFLCGVSLQAQNDYYPLEKGKVWMYKYSSDFSQEDASLAKTEVLSTTKTINGEEYFIVQTSMGTAEKMEPLIKIYLLEKEGKIIGVVNPETPENNIFLPAAPLKEGKSWTTSMMNMTSTVSIISTKSSIVTPQKTFNDCLVIRTDMKNSMVQSYFQKGTGMVAISIIMNGEEKLMQYLVE